MKYSYQAGFTLVEMISTIVILAILTGVAVPSYQAVVEKNRIKSYSNSVFTSFVNARSEATKRNQPVVMCSSGNGVDCSGSQSWERGWVVYVDANNDGGQDPGESIVQSNLSLPKSVTLRATLADQTAIIFSADGTLATREIFDLCVDDDPDKGASILISVTGRPSLKAGATECP